MSSLILFNFRNQMCFRLILTKKQHELLIEIEQLHLIEQIFFKVITICLDNVKILARFRL